MICLKTYQQTEKELTKESLYTALIELMGEMDFDKISITDIAKRAGVSRMAYYRHYDSKEAIFTKHLEDLFMAYQAQVIAERNNIHHAMVLFFNFFRAQKALLIHLQKAQMSLFLLTKFDEYVAHLLQHIDLAPDLNEFDLASKTKFIAGGLFQLLNDWLRHEFKPSNTVMSQVATKFVSAILSTK